MKEAKKAALLQLLALSKDARVNKLKKKKAPALPPLGELPGAEEPGC